MNLSIFGKIGTIFKYFTSSYLGIEMFILSLILILFLIFNIRKRNILASFIVTAVIILMFLFVIGGYINFAGECLKAFIKYVMRYYYFPNVAVYFTSVFIMMIILVYTSYTKKIDEKKRTFNIVVLGLVLMNFLALISHTIFDKVELTLTYKIYEDDLILSCVQISNFLILIYIVVTIIYYIYKYLKKKYDE